jgi:hypothetical protein
MILNPWQSLPWIQSSVVTNPTVLSLVMLYIPVGPKACGAFTRWKKGLVCNKMKGIWVLQHSSICKFYGAMAIPHRSIHRRFSQLFTEFPLIWFTNFEFLEPRKLIFVCKVYNFYPLCCPLNSATQSSHTTPTSHTPHPWCSTHNQKQCFEEYSFRITGLQECNIRQTAPNFLS